MVLGEDEGVLARLPREASRAGPAAPRRAAKPAVGEGRIVSAPVEQCSALVFSGVWPSKCSRRARPGTKFCRQHDPGVAAERVAKATKNSDAQWAEHLANRALDRACVALAVECIAKVTELPPPVRVLVEECIRLRAERDEAMRTRVGLGLKPW